MKRGVVLAAATGLLVSGSPAAAASRVVTIDSPGVWTLKRLGYGEIVLRGDDRNAHDRASVVYRLPAGVAQGRGGWYLLRLHYVAQLARDPASGTFNVAAATNGRTSGSTIFTVGRKRGRIVVRADDLGLVRGSEIRQSSSLRQEIFFENYLAIKGVRPGANTLTFEVTSNSIPLVETVRILADTGIELSRLGPASIDLGVHVPDRDIRVGDEFRVEFQLRHERGRLVDDATFEVAYPPGAFEVVGGRRRTLRWMSREPLRGSFELRPLRRGQLPLEVRAEAAGGLPSARTAVHVRERDRRDARDALWLALPLGAVLVGALAVGMRRRRKVGSG